MYIKLKCTRTTFILGVQIAYATIISTSSVEFLLFCQIILKKLVYFGLKGPTIFKHLVPEVENFSIAIAN